MDGIKTILSQGWVGSLLGLLGLIAAIYFFRASRISARLCFQAQALRLIGREYQALPDDVEILYKGNKVDRLTKVNIAIWNSGKAMLDGKNLIKADPVRFEVNKDERILSANILKVTREYIKFNVNVNTEADNQIICSFDYLNPGDGAVIELLHTDTKRYPIEKGTIKGLPKGLINWGHIVSSKPSIAKSMSTSTSLISRLFLGKPFLYIMAIAGGIASIIGVISEIYSTSALNKVIGKGNGWPMAIAGCVYMLPTCLLLWLSRRKFPKELKIDDFD
jgi:hypothetical protein